VRGLLTQLPRATASGRAPAREQDSYGGEGESGLTVPKTEPIRTAPPWGGGGQLPRAHWQALGLSPGQPRPSARLPRARALQGRAASGAPWALCQRTVTFSISVPVVDGEAAKDGPRHCHLAPRMNDGPSDAGAQWSGIMRVIKSVIRLSTVLRVLITSPPAARRRCSGGKHKTDAART
jgi:hypothetical protein